jgi:hypothetical protein
MKMKTKLKAGGIKETAGRLWGALVEAIGDPSFQPATQNSASGTRG